MDSEGAQQGLFFPITQSQIKGSALSYLTTITIVLDFREAIALYFVYFFGRCVAGLAVESPL
jgi:hypothetical protein